MSLPQSAPSVEGVDAEGIVAFLDALLDSGVAAHSLAVARHGRVVARGWWTPYAADRVQLVYSLSKSLTATAIGFLVQEGRLELADPILRRVPHSGRGFHERWRQVTVRHCLSMTVGHDRDAWDAVMERAAAGSGADGAARQDWVDVALRIPPDHEPGTTFTYNQVATYLLSCAVTHLTGERVVDFLRPRLFEPLGMGPVYWHTDPRGRDLGFTGAHVSTDALLAFAQFCLDRGSWQGRSLLDASWFAAATAMGGPPNRDPAAGPDWHQGYGFSFWGARHGFRGDGAFGQFAIVLPEQDAVVALTSEHTDMQQVLDALWDHLLPALGRGGSPRSDSVLRGRLASLGSPALHGSALGPELATFGRRGSEGLPAAYTAVSVRREGNGHLLELERAGQLLEVRVGDGQWLDSTLEADGLVLPVVASGGWEQEDVFRAEVLVIETPHRFRVEGRLRSGDADLVWREEPFTARDPLWLAVRRAPGA